ncbi:hypothetical protein CAEBREN_08284 [Caenorhabditis brenneri]|uniref:F-box domain-containing protein n=1 Tax=Caenorhabditis brenneri TaxID=135651 RepID=G0MC10_CAEBE|nr:hypothetical protein CAEBREN_08284 [Caenorhabditis brenneri]
MDSSHQPTFPLLRLPVNAQKNVLRSMEIMDIWSLSLCSKTTKVLAKSINLKPKSCVVRLDGLVDSTVNSQDFTIQLQVYPDRNAQTMPNRKKQKADYVIITYTEISSSESKVYRSKNFKTAGDWFCHFSSIFHISSVNRLEMVQFCYFLSVKETLKRMEIRNIWIYETLQAVHARKILIPLSRAKSIILAKNPYISVYEKRRVLVQNWLGLNLNNEFLITIDDLLMTNCTYLISWWSEWPQEMINRWLKLWRSGSNRNLKYLVLAIIGTDPNVILKGIKYQVVPESTVQIFDGNDMGDLRNRTEEVKGGFDIWRNDGVRATVAIKDHLDHWRFQFCLWP